MKLLPPKKKKKQKKNCYKKLEGYPAKTHISHQLTQVVLTTELEEVEYGEIWNIKGYLTKVVH